MKENLKILKKAILAGFFIGIGGIAFLSIPDKIVGSIAFSIGLFAILNFELNLFTGKVCYVLENKKFKDATLIYLGNLIGALLIAVLLGLLGFPFFERAREMSEAKLNNYFWVLFIKGILCNILIYLAVYGFANFKSDISKFMAIIFGVSIFIICGFEHCVADMFYFAYSGVLFSLNGILALIVVSIGNIVGGILARHFLKENS